MRFPGGCIVEGSETWTSVTSGKKTIAPVADDSSRHRWNYEFLHRPARIITSLWPGFL